MSWKLKTSVIILQVWQVFCIYFILPFFQWFSKYSLHLFSSIQPFGKYLLTTYYVLPGTSAENKGDRLLSVMELIFNWGQGKVQQVNTRYLQLLLCAVKKVKKKKRLVSICKSGVGHLTRNMNGKSQPSKVWWSSLKAGLVGRVWGTQRELVSLKRLWDWGWVLPNEVREIGQDQISFQERDCPRHLSRGLVWFDPCFRSLLCLLCRESGQ